MKCSVIFLIFLFHQRIIAHHHQHERPNSAPVATHRTPSQRNAHRPRQSLPSEQSSLASSRNSSPVSMVSSTGSSSIPDVINSIHDIRPRFTLPSTANATNNTNQNHSEDDERDQNDSASESKSTWPYSISRPITCLFCTLGLFNISRFAIFSVHFGGMYCNGFFSMLAGSNLWISCVRVYF
jgi:solute carrier family 6 (neurotransmitter transporter), invertebrate